MQRLRVGLAVLVASVWLVGYVLAYKQGTQSPTELSGLMAVVLGWAFAGTIRNSIKGSGDEQREREHDDSREA